MVEYLEGANIWDVETMWAVIPVNCVGVPGKGLAKQWADRFPHAAELYRKNNLPMQPGDLRTYPPDHIILAATKNHWQHPSRLSWVITCLWGLSQWENLGVVSLPKLGCGNGGLDWALVKPYYDRLLTPCATLFRVCT